MYTTNFSVPYNNDIGIGFFNSIHNELRALLVYRLIDDEHYFVEVRSGKVSYTPHAQLHGT